MVLIRGAITSPVHAVILHIICLHIVIEAYGVFQSRVLVDHMIAQICVPLKQLRSDPFLANWISGLIAFAIIWLSLAPLTEFPNVPDGDKTYHIIAYAALAIPTAFAYPKRLLMMAVLYILLGGLIELIQPFVNRYSELLDFMANLFGVILGSFIGLFLSKRVRN